MIQLVSHKDNRITVQWLCLILLWGLANIGTQQMLKLFVSPQAAIALSFTLTGLLYYKAKRGNDGSPTLAVIGIFSSLGILLYFLQVAFT